MLHAFIPDLEQGGQVNLHKVVQMNCIPFLGL